MSKKKLKFKAGDFVVYPAHGVGQVTAVDKLEIAGSELEVFVINFENDKMTLRVPIDKAESSGMRHIASSEIISKAMTTLSGRARAKRAMWSRRAQEYEQKINSGDLVSIAEVVRDLHRQDDSKEQSYSERQLYEAALGHLTREIAAADGSNENEALERVDAVLGSRAA